MPGIARMGQDTAGGLIVGPPKTRVLVGNRPAAVIGDAVASHGSDAHAAAAMNRASSRVKASGFPVCRAKDTASCGHLATGSSDVEAG